MKLPLIMDVIAAGSGAPSRPAQAARPARAMPSSSIPGSQARDRAREELREIAELFKRAAAESRLCLTTAKASYNRAQELLDGLEKGPPSDARALVHRLRPGIRAQLKPIPSLRDRMQAAADLWSRALANP